MRFIDLAGDGGCSKKAPAREVRELLDLVQARFPGANLDIISRDFPDCGAFEVIGLTMLSTVDIVLPMTLSPADFGRITACHVLSDLYASAAKPLFALCILGVPRGMSASSSEAVQSLSAAAEKLSVEGVALVGGHTMTDQEDFYLGFAAVGVNSTKRPPRLPAQVGDSLILTKPLGTGIATLRWKLEEATEEEHRDVIGGMSQSNAEAARVLEGYDVRGCTDVTGYGLLGHLYNLLYAGGVGAKVKTGAIPVYGSLVGIRKSYQSRQAAHNIEYVKDSLIYRSTPGLLLESLLFDSQVSGGLLLSVPSSQAEALVQSLRGVGYSPAVIGEVGSAESGTIELID